MVDAGFVKKAQEDLQGELGAETKEALEPEPKDGSRSFHAGKARGLKQVLTELAVIDLQMRPQGLAAALETFKKDATAAAEKVRKPEARSSYRDFQAGLYQGLQRGIDRLNPGEKNA